MTNFYGGKEGRSFVITKEFHSIAEMTEAFKKGPSYVDVNFDEYVLINTVNKNSPENGQLFRRGYDYNSDRTILNYHLGIENPSTDEQKAYYTAEIPAGGAIYVGTIVGPAGRAPKLNFGLYKDVEALSKVFNMKEDSVSNSHTKDVATMIKYLNENYLEGIKKDDVVYYYVIWPVVLNEVTTNYYFGLDRDLYNQKTEHSIGWYSLDSLPKTGADSFNLSNELIPAVEYTGGWITDDQGRFHKEIKGYHDTVDWNYFTIRNENGEDSTAYLGMRIPAPMMELEAESVDPYYGRNDGDGSNIFTNVNLANEVLTAQDGSDMAEHPFYFKWNIKVPRGIKGDCLQNIRVIPADESVVELVLDSDGKLVYNKDNEVSTQTYAGRDDDIANGRQVIVCDFINYDRYPTGEKFTLYIGDYNQIESMALAADGTFTIDYTHDDTMTYSKLIDWITDVKFETDGTVEITFNNDSILDGKLSKPQLINWLTSFTLDPDTGAFRTTFNNANIPGIDTTLQWVKDISIAADGTVTFDYTNIVDKVLSGANRINWIKSCTFNNDTGALSIVFNNDNIADISKTLNYIKSFERDANDHLIITHSDPAIGVQDLGSISYMVAAPAENEATANLAPNGVWIITQEI